MPDASFAGAFGILYAYTSLARKWQLWQLDGAFRLKSGTNVRGHRVVLVDDALTTGATLESVARTLLAAAAGRVDALVFTQV